MNILDLKNFRCYRNTDDSVFKYTGTRISSSVKMKLRGIVLPQQKQSDVLTHIFAPDPKTGLPKSDIAYIMSQDSSPEIAQYIQNNIMRPIQQAISGSSNPDDAIAAVRQVGESFEAFADRLKENFATPTVSDDNEEVE